MLLFGWFFPLPCLRAPGRGVPGFLAGPALVFCCCFSSMIPILSFIIFTRMSHVSQCTKGSAPIRESCTDFSPLINRWWTNRTRLHEPIGLRAKKTVSDVLFVLRFDKGEFTDCLRFVISFTCYGTQKIRFIKRWNLTMSLYPSLRIEKEVRLLLFTCPAL